MLLVAHVALCIESYSLLNAFLSNMWFPDVRKNYLLLMAVEYRIYQRLHSRLLLGVYGLV